MNLEQIGGLFALHVNTCLTLLEFCGEVSCSQSLQHFTSLDPEKSHDIEFSSLYV